MTKANQNSSQNKREPFGSRFPEIAVFIKVMIVILSIYLFFEVSERFSCVEAPNGLLLGQINPFTKFEGTEPDIAIKYPDGKLMFYGVGDIDFWGKRGFSGRVRQPNGESSGAFVYVNDVGLVFENKTPELYQKYYDKIEPVRPEEGININGNIYYYYSAFQGSLPGPEKKSNSLFKKPRAYCPTEWFTPKLRPIRAFLQI